MEIVLHAATLPGSYLVGKKKKCSLTCLWNCVGSHCPEFNEKLLPLSSLIASKYCSTFYPICTHKLIIIKKTPYNAEFHISRFHNLKCWPLVPTAWLWETLKWDFCFLILRRGLKMRNPYPHFLCLFEGRGKQRCKQTLRPRGRRLVNTCPQQFFSSNT